MYNKALIFDSEQFNKTSILQKITYITKNPLIELYHANDLESFSSLIIHGAPYEMIIINFQMIEFIDCTGAQLEAFVFDIKRCQREPCTIVAVTSWPNQIATLMRLELYLTHKDYNGIAIDVASGIRSKNKALSKEEITRIICTYYGLSFKKIFIKSRKKENVKARQIAMYFCKVFTKDSLKVIGEFFNGRDHTTVIHSCQSVKDHMDTEKEYQGEVFILQGMIEQLRDFKKTIA